MDCITVLDSQYVAYCRSVRDCFGCVGLRNAQYCILNKQYTKEAYETLVAKIKKEMQAMPYVDAKGRSYAYGEFFPPEISPFGFNESQGYEYFQISREEVEKLGFNWRVPEKRNYPITKKTSELPDVIGEVTDEILQDVIQCAHDETGEHPFRCGDNCPTAFRITPQELQFYRHMNLPLPRLCFNCRHSERVTWRNVPQLYPRSCGCSGAQSNHGGYQNTAKHFHEGAACPNTFETSYAPDRREIVYCEQCYQAEVV